MTNKTTLELFEVYRPKSKDEQKFVDKHVTIKHADRNGNGDDVFNATNVKTIKRSADGHGYDVGEDEKVYEDVEELDELSRAILGRYSKRAKSDADNGEGKDRSKSRFLAGKKRWGGTGGIEAARVPATESVDESFDEEALDELVEAMKNATTSYKHYTFTTGPAMKGAREGAVDHVDGHHKKATKLGVPLDSTKSYGETRLVTAKNNTTGEVSHHHVYQRAPGTDTAKPLISVRSVGREQPHTAKHQNALKSYLSGKTKLKEAFEGLDQIDELSRGLIKNYVKKSEEDLGRSQRAIAASAKRKGVSIETEYDSPAAAGQTHRQYKRYRGQDDADYKLSGRARVNAKEEVEVEGEQIDEISKATAIDYFHKAQDQMRRNSDPRYKPVHRKPGVMLAKKKVEGSARINATESRLTMENIVDRTLDKYLQEEVEVPTLGVRMTRALEGVRESHVRALMGLFNSLNEENQQRMLETVENEGIGDLLDFAIQNKG